MNVSPQATGGSVENVTRVSSGEMDMSLAHASHMWEIWNGKGTFRGKQAKNIRGVCMVYDSPHYFVALKKSGIRSMKDLEEKRVSLGPPGSGTAYNSKLALDALGIKVKESQLSFADAARACKDGHLDAFGQSGAPAAGIVELAATEDIVIIPFTDDELKKICEVAPYFRPGVMKAGIYRGQDKDVPVFTFLVYWIANKDVPADVVYQMLKVAMDNKEYLKSVHPE